MTENALDHRRDRGGLGPRRQAIPPPGWRRQRGVGSIPRAAGRLGATRSTNTACSSTSPDRDSRSGTRNLGRLPSSGSAVAPAPPAPGRACPDERRVAPGAGEPFRGTPRRRVSVYSTTPACCPRDDGRISQPDLAAKPFAGDVEHVEGSRSGWPARRRRRASRARCTSSPSQNALSRRADAPGRYLRSRRRHIEHAHEAIPRRDCGTTLSPGQHLLVGGRMNRGGSGAIDRLVLHTSWV